jgi:hypothetical protein
MPQEYVCITRDFTTEITYTCLVSVMFHDGNYVCFYHFYEILLLKLSTLVSCCPNLYVASPSSPTDLITLVSSVDQYTLGSFPAFKLPFIPFNQGIMVRFPARRRDVFFSEAFRSVLGPMDIGGTSGCNEVDHLTGI